MTTAWHRPRDLADALAARAAHPDWTVLAGGTDLMVGVVHRPPPPGVLDLFGLPDLEGVDELPGGGLRIGAATTYAMLRDDPHVVRHLPALAAASREVGAMQIQERGTLGGNVVTGSPVGDTLPVLLAVDAEVELASLRGVRTLAYEDFCTGYRSRDLAPDELLVALRFPHAGAWTDRGVRHIWRKVGTRRAQSISKVMLAGALGCDEAGRLDLVRLAFGAVRERPVRARAAEAAALGHVPGPEAASAAAAALEADIAPIDDVRSTAGHRRAVARRLLARALAAAG